MSEAPAGPTGPAPLSVTTWNVNGIRARAAQVLEWVEKERPDLLCLQEIKASPEDVPAALCSLPGYWCFWHGHKGYSGVSLNLRKERFPEPPAFVHPAFDFEHRMVMVEVGDLLVASVYVPNGGKDLPAKMRFLEAMAAFVEETHRSGKRLLLVGDMNVAREERDVHPALRNARQVGQTPEERAAFDRLLGLGLVDVHRVFAPDDDRLFTWWAPWRNLRGRNMGWRLDYVLASQPLASAARTCRSFREFGTSDHGPVSATFAV